MTFRVWAVRAGGDSEADPLFIENGQIAVSFRDVDQDVSALPAQRSAFKDAFAQSGEAKPSAIPAQALYELGSVLTLFELRNFAAEFTRRFEPPAGDSAVKSLALNDDETEARVARDIAETTRDFIAKRIKTDLKGFPLEPFVADLFRAMGYNAHATRAVRDDGIDVIAHRDELGIEPPILKIQVKAHEGNVGPDLVKAFYAMVHDRDVGIFVTTGGYTVAAQNFAGAKGNLKLVDGVEFVSRRKILRRARPEIPKADPAAAHVGAGRAAGSISYRPARTAAAIFNGPGREANDKRPAKCRPSIHWKTSEFSLRWT